LIKCLNLPEISAEALYYLGVSKEIDGVSGKFFNLTTEEELAPPVGPKMLPGNCGFDAGNDRC
jgi:hypothetical protein